MQDQDGQYNNINFQILREKYMNGTISCEVDISFKVAIRPWDRSYLEVFTHLVFVEVNGAQEGVKQ